VRLRHPADGTQIRALDGHHGRVTAMCAVPAGSRTFLATSSDDGTVCLWDPADGTQVCALTLVPVDGHRGWHRGGISAVCAVLVGSRTLLAFGSDDGTVCLWDPADGTQVRALNYQVLSVDRVERGLTYIRVLDGRRGRVTSMCAVPAGSRTFLATGSDDGTVCLWDPADGTQVRVLDGHQGRATSMCAVPAGSRTFLATGSEDQTVRLWDLAQGRCVLAVPVHSAAWAVASAVGSLAVGLSAGVLVIRLEPDYLEQPSSS
jgi:WD40 repeat protein